MSAIRLKAACLGAVLALPLGAFASSPYIGPEVVLFGSTPAQFSGGANRTQPETTLSPEQASGLLKNAKILSEYPRVVVRLEGHASPLECLPERCLELSRARVNLVREFLLGHGVNPLQIESMVAYGSRRTRVSSEIEIFGKGRVEIIFVTLLPGA